MRRGLGFMLVVGGVLLLGGVALAQQGLIIDPWGRHAPRALTPSEATGAAVKAQRAPGQAGSKLPIREAESALDSQWKPAVPVDLIDPWAPRPAAPVVTAALAGGRNWAKPLVDLVDPWAAERPSSARSVSPPRQSIY